MAVYGFSIFLGSISIFIHVTIFLILAVFKKHRDNKGTYFDAMMCGCMAVYLSLYYMALNYPEGVPTEEKDIGKRNLLSCIVIILLMLGFMIASLSYMCAGAFWYFINITSPSRPSSANTDTEGAKSVTFGSEEDNNSAKRETFLRETNNKIMLAITMASLGLPVLYILINIFMSDDTDADIIHSDHRCWVGGVGGELMWTLIFLPCILTITTTIILYLWGGFKTSGRELLSATKDAKLLNLQFRVILAAGLGLWWLIEIPALSKSSLGVVQHINGFINIPFAILAFYTFVTQRPEVLETWNHHFPIARKAKKEVSMVWKYYIYRPVMQKLFRHQSKSKKRSTSPGSTPTNPPGHAEESAAPLDVPPRPAQYYSTEESMAGEYVEFQGPNLYVNEVVLVEESEHVTDYDMPPKVPEYDMPAPPQQAGVSSYQLEEQQGYDNLQREESPLYIDPVEEGGNDYTLTSL